MTKQAKVKNLFDHKFVVAAALIGAVYTAIVIILEAAVGKEAAGVGGVALTALATGIFSKFETLRFRSIAASEGVEVRIPTTNWFAVVAFALAFVGAQTLMAQLTALLGYALHQLPDDPTTLLAHPSSRFIAMAVGVQALSYLIAGYLATRAMAIPRYSTILIAAIVALATQLSLSLLTLDASLTSMWRGLMANLAPAAYWVLYLSTALVGAWLAKPRLYWSGRQIEPA